MKNCHIPPLCAPYSELSFLTLPSELIWLQHLLSGLSLKPLNQDDITWCWSESCIYTVRGGYRAMKNTPRIQRGAHKIWKLHVPSRMKVLEWLMLLNRFFTIDNLNRRGWPIVNQLSTYWMTAFSQNQYTTSW